MPVDPRKRQKQQERRAAKRKSKAQQLVKEKLAGIGERLTAAAKYPVLHCWAGEGLWKNGLGQVTLSRQLPNGSVAFAVFLVDRSCLGVKDAFSRITSRFDYDSQIARKMHGEMAGRPISPATARKLVEKAVEYAESLGLHPHPDYHKAKPIFGTINASECTEEFEFGQDGKPHFVVGPHDTPERCRRILKALEEHCGPGEFHYTMPADLADEVLPASLQGQEARLISRDETGAIREWKENPSEDQD